jgi:hypothetical protein
MKIILSRKGFDSSAGKHPSPIFTDGTMISLPIPDKASKIAYADIAGNRLASVGQLVRDLASIPQTHRAHLDPDVSAHSIPRAEGWRPLFGQVGAAEKHLQNHGVDSGDLFLFFGWFRNVEKSGGYWRYVRSSRPVHVTFGWLQVDERVPVSDWPKGASWALQHPHFQREPDATNALYVGAKQVTLPGLPNNSIPGAGIFNRFTPVLQLAKPGGGNRSVWQLPNWFHPNGRRSTLSYHDSPARWRTTEGGVELNSVARGQEFVLDCANYPEAIGWLAQLLALRA